jgi:hypothetical protein
MSWLAHPAYKPVRNRIISRFRAEVYTFKSLRPVIFLCGGALSRRRDYVAKYIRKHHPDKLVFYADDVWAQIAKIQSSGSKKRKHTANALEMERQLAGFADMVAIIVESAGTFTELGAFSLSDELRRKVLPIIDVSYKNDESFINTGPVRWVDIDSTFAPTIFVDFEVILSAVAEIDDRLGRLTRTGRGREKVKEITNSPRHLLFLLCDLLAIIGPAPESHCGYYLRRITGKKRTSWDAENLLSLGVSLGIIKSFTNGHGELMYYRPLENDDLESYLYRHVFSLRAWRARHLSVLQKMFDAKQISEYFKAA